jgi:hypothetical protein
VDLLSAAFEHESKTSRAAVVLNLPSDPAKISPAEQLVLALVAGLLPETGVCW